ncbi:MAG: hypothetical protein WCI18_12875 [Pseudomonadota bacterium]
MIKILFFLLPFWACVTSSSNVPDRKQYLRDSASLNNLNVSASRTLNCIKQLPSKGKIEGQKFSVTLSRTSPSFYKIGLTEDRPLRHFGILQDREYWGELPEYDLAVRVGVKSLTQVTLALYNQKGDISQTIEFTDCKLI